MRKNFSLALFAVASFSNAEIIDCNITVNDVIGKNEHLNVSIFIPPEQSLVVGLYDSDSVEFDSFVSIDEVTKGSIQISFESGNKREYDFIATRLPGGGNSLVGYYMNQGYVTSVKADLWDDNKPIYLHDTGAIDDKLMSGNCK